MNYLFFCSELRNVGWTNEAKGKAAVHCVIISFGLEDIEIKRIFDYTNINGDPTEKKARNINPYLVEGNDLIIRKRSKSISDAPAMLYGNKIVDGGFYLFTDQEKEAFIQSH